MKIRLSLAKRLNPLPEPGAFAAPCIEIGQASTSVIDFDPIEQAGQYPVPMVSDPLTYELGDFGIANALPRVIVFDPVESPSQAIISVIDASPSVDIDYPFTPLIVDMIDLLAGPLEHWAEDCGLTKPDINEFRNYIETPTVEDLADFFVDLLSIPVVETLLEPIARPRATGTRFRHFLGTDVDDRQQRLFSFEPSVQCRHGLLRDLCGMCREEREKQAAKRRSARSEAPATEDVFEQLWYILQPPIFKPLGQPTIFPNGCKPYGFQIAGVDWLVKRHNALLADEMGLGKTIQAIIAMRILFRNGELQRALVVCPASLTINWEREFKSWAPELRQLRIKGNKDVRVEAWRSPAEVYIVSYETLTVDINAGRLQPHRFDLYVLDEVQKIKNPAIKNHKAVKRLNPSWRWGLSGTPIENSIDDVLAIFSVLKPGLLDDLYWLNEAVVREKIKPYTLRRQIGDEDVDVDFPEISHQQHWLELTESQRSRYHSAELGGIEGIRARGSDATRIHVLALITKLKQICNYDEVSGESSKLEFLRDELEKVSDSGEKALVFSQYPNKTLRQIEPKLSQFAPLTYDGTLNDKQRQKIVDEFQVEEEHQILMMSVRAGGMGINLTRANHVFHFDHWWNPAAVDQATARIYRIGQNRPVFAHSLYSRDTIEERIAELLEKKRQTFEAVFGAELDDKSMERLTDEDLFGLFGLKPPNKRQSDREAPQTRLVSHPPSPAISGLKKRKSFSDMTPVEFEEAICAMFEHLGYRLQLTQRTRDGGVDLDGHSLGVGNERIVVQCKRYSGTVGVGVVRELFGVISADQSISKGYVVTTSKFSQEARDLERKTRITLIDGNYLNFLASTVGE